MEVQADEKRQSALGGGASVGTKRQRERRVSWSDREDADGDRRMESDPDDAAIEDDDGPSRKRAMLIKTNLRFLEKIPPLRDYQRARNGRRGAIDGGAVTGALMMAALEESFEETSFVTLEPPTREAMVAPVPRTVIPSSATMMGPSSREVPPTAPSQRISPVRAMTRPVSFAKDDEARPASE